MRGSFSSIKLGKSSIASIRDTVPEIDVGSMCITDLFQNKSVAFFTPKFSPMYMLCNFFSVDATMFFEENLKLKKKHRTEKLHSIKAKKILNFFRNYLILA